MSLRVAGDGRPGRLVLSIDPGIAAERVESFSGRETTYSFTWRLTVSEPTAAEQSAGEAERLIEARLRCDVGGRTCHTSRSLPIKILLDRGRIRRLGTGNLDRILGMMPKGMRG